MRRHENRSSPSAPWLLVSVLVWIALLPDARAQQSAPPLLPALDQVRRDHPRLLIRPGDTPHAVPLALLRSPIDNDPPAAALLVQLRSQSSAAAQAMVHLLTGEDAAATRAIARLRAYRYPGNVDTFHVYFRLTEFALAYDWLHGHPGMTADVRREIRDNVAPLAAEGLRVSNDHVFHNYVWMSAGGVALWALATAHEDEASDRLFEQVRARFNERLYPALHYLDGLPSEPMGYWALYVFTPAVQTLLAFQSATETDLASLVHANRGDWLARNVRTLVHHTLPDLRYVPFGDLQSGPNGGVTRDVAGILDASAWALRSPEASAFSQHLSKKLGLSRFRADTAIYYFLYTRHLPRRVDAPPAWPVLGHLAGDSKGGQFVARSDWTDDATIIAFRCADHFGDHNHWDQGSFLIYRKGLLAVDPPVYRTTRGPQQKTEYHNTLLIGGQPQRPVRGQTFPTLEQFRRNLAAGKRLETGDVLFSHDAGKWAAVSGQFAQAYDVPALESCTRQLLYVRPGTLVVVDHLTAKAGQTLPDVQWLLHFPARPTDERGTLSLTPPQSYLRCRALVPGDAVNPKIDPTPMNTVRAAYTYPGGGRVRLVHLLEVGPSDEPAPPTPATVEFTDDATHVALGLTRFRFASRPPFAISEFSR